MNSIMSHLVVMLSYYYEARNYYYEGMLANKLSLN